MARNYPFNHSLLAMAVLQVVPLSVFSQESGKRTTTVGGRHRHYQDFLLGNAPKGWL